VGGLINIITKKSNKCSLFSADVFTSWFETNIDLGKTQCWQESHGTRFKLFQIQSKN
jgi:hypothetical protein